MKKNINIMIIITLTLMFTLISFTSFGEGEKISKTEIKTEQNNSSIQDDSNFNINKLKPITPTLATFEDDSIK